MASNSALAIMEEVDQEYSYVPVEILMTIMACLPFASLFRSRSVAKAWNEIVLHPHFQRARATLSKAFIVNVMNCAKLWSCRLKRSAGKVLVMAKGAQDIFVVRPSNFSVRQIPRLHCALRVRNLETFVVGVVVNALTEDYILFAVTEFRSALRGPRNIIGAEGRATEPNVRRNLHFYSSVAKIWSLCGDGELDLNATTMNGSYHDRKQVVGVIMHRGRFVALVRSVRGFVGRSFHNDVYELFFYNVHRWQRMYGVLQPVFNKGVVMFDHLDTLYLAAPSFSGLVLWHFAHITEKWHLVRDFRYPLVPDIQCGLGKWKFVNVAYAQAFGDYLHFGAFNPPDSLRFVHIWEPRCRMLAYNLVSGKVEDVAHHQAHVRMVTKASSGQKMLLEFEN